MLAAGCLFGGLHVNCKICNGSVTVIVLNIISVTNMFANLANSIFFFPCQKEKKLRGGGGGGGGGREKFLGKPETIRSHLQRCAK